MPSATFTTSCAVCELHAEASFRVEGMDCHEEVVILERRLGPLAGIERISADVVGQRLHVQYDAAKLTTAAMVAAVAPTGMRIWLEHEAPRVSGSHATRRLWLAVGAALSMTAGMACAPLGYPGLTPWLSSLAVALGGVFPARRALAALRSRAVDINLLMVIAVVGAVLLRDWTEAAAVVVLFSIAQWLEARTLERARQAIGALVGLAPRVATVRRGGAEHTLDIAQVVPGDEVIVRPGEKVPVDGVVVVGHSDLNESSLTGESLPVDKRPGDLVYAGAINGRGALDIRVSRVGADTRVARVVHLVEVAQARRAPVQSLIDRFATFYTPAVIAASVLVAFGPPLVAGGDLATWGYRALVLLVVACPCALVISTPVSVVAALSTAARHGVLIKGGAYLERLAATRIVAFDKTGTLTSGILDVVEIVSRSGSTALEVLRYAAAIEARAEHPVAKAIVRHAKGRAVAVPVVSEFTTTPGNGAEGEVDGRRVRVGHERWLVANGVDVSALAPALAVTPRAEQSLVLVAIDNVAIGAIALADRVRGTAREAVDLLRAYGIERTVMLTGDREETAAAVAAAVGVDEYHAALLPEHKHTLVSAMRARVARQAGGRGAVLMVGDGVNDAPALAAADVGIAMGAAGSDVALETADVALMSDELLKLPYAIRLARVTLRNIKVNVAVSLALKALFLVLAITGSATLWMAVLADTGASVLVVANALRLLREK